MKPRNVRRNARARLNGRSGQLVVADYIDPPMIPSVTKITRKYRFACSGNLGATISSANVIGIAGAMCTVTNSTLTYIAFAAQVHKIEVWAPASTNAVMVQTEIQWYTMNQGPGREVCNTSMTPARPSYTKSKPRNGEWAFQRFSSGSTPVFGISCPAGSIIDLHCSHWLSDLAGANTTQACTVAVVGELYYTALDGTTKTAVPVGLPMAA